MRDVVVLLCCCCYTDFFKFLENEHSGRPTTDGHMQSGLYDVDLGVADRWHEPSQGYLRTTARMGRDTQGSSLCLGNGIRRRVAYRNSYDGDGSMHRCMYVRVCVSVCVSIARSRMYDGTRPYEVRQRFSKFQSNVGTLSSIIP